MNWLIQLIYQTYKPIEAGARSFVRAELSRRPLRKRVIHLIILGRFSSAGEVVMQIRKDSLSEEIAQEDADRIQEIIDEVICFIYLFFSFIRRIFEF